MTPSVVVDSNIIVSAVLGLSGPFLRLVAENVHVILPERVYDEASKRTATLLAQKMHAPVDLSFILDITNWAPTAFVDRHEHDARWLLDADRQSDWPILATAMVYGAPVWTNDKDFAGTGVATWNNRTIRYLINGGIPPERG